MTTDNDKEAVRHRVLAEAEARKWEATPAELRKKSGIGESLAVEGGPSSGSIRLRHEIWRAGPAADELWRALDDGLPLYTAARILRQARTRIGRDLPLLPEAIAEEMALLRSRPRDSKRFGIPVVPPPPPPPPDSGVGPWDKIRSAMMGVCEAMTSDFAPDVAAQLRSEFDVELRRSVSWLQTRVRAATRAVPMSALIPARRDVAQWCVILCMDPPKPGRPVDESILRRQYRALSVRYHPDLNPNIPGRSQAQVDINQAYQGLTEYNESLKETDK